LGQERPGGRDRRQEGRSEQREDHDRQSEVTRPRPHEQRPEQRSTGRNTRSEQEGDERQSRRNLKQIDREKKHRERSNNRLHEEQKYDETQSFPRKQSARGKGGQEEAFERMPLALPGPALAEGEDQCKRNREP